MRIEIQPGFSLNVHLRHRGDDNRAPLVLLHGFTGSSEGWGLFGELLAESHSLLLVDIVGHGASDAPADLEHYRMANAADDVVAAVAKAGFDHANWLGYSMGGRLALAIATQHPRSMERLILIGASPGIEREDERAARVKADELLASQLERDGIRPFVDYWESIPLFDTQRSLPAEVRAAIRAGRLKNTEVGLANSLRGMGAGAQAPLHHRLATLGVPALLLAGEADAKYAAIAASMASAMPCARAAVIPHAGHAAHLEQPARTAQEVLAFLATPLHHTSRGVNS